MPAQLGRDTIARIEDALRDAGPVIPPSYIRQLVKDYNTTIQTIYYHKKRILANAPVMPRSGGALRIITWNIEQAIKLLLDKQPWYYQDEIADFLLLAYGIVVH